MPGNPKRLPIANMKVPPIRRTWTGITWTAANEEWNLFMVPRLLKKVPCSNYNLPGFLEPAVFSRKNRKGQHEKPGD
jgi:hypothetical protein